MPTTYDRPWLAGWDGTGEGRAPPWRDTRELERGQFRFACHLSWPEEPLGLSCTCSDNGGATVVGVDRGSPADRAGLRRGMRVVSVCGHSIYTESDLVQARTFAAHDGARTVSVTATNIALHPPTSPRGAGRDATSFSVADAVAIRTMPHLLTRHPHHLHQPRPPPPPPPALQQQHLASPHSHHRSHHIPHSSPRSPSSWRPGGGGSSSSLFRVTGGGASGEGLPHSVRSGAYGEAAVDRYGSGGLSHPHVSPTQPGAALWQDRPPVDREATYMGGRPFPPLTASLPPKIR